ncbi:MAG: polysaccharide biosynthesis protein [Anaerolineae bacterium CG_4_9_14_0_8_um_filter_58_9]|nr:MAG: polysaccharide biosynthesis protein [Anaerolineae bacterium CG_4_9_14_0_8_um_filter_58_9]
MDASMNIKSRLNIRNRFVILIDLLLTIASVMGAYALRLEGTYFYFYLPSAYWLIAVSLIIKPMTYYLFGLYRRQWAYASTNELKLISMAVTVASAIVSAVMIALYSAQFFIGFPRSTLAIDWVLSLIGIGGFRLSMRLIAESQASGVKRPAGRVRNVLVVGAGDAGALVVREIQKNPQLSLRPIGYLDDEQAKQKHQIYSIPVIGKLADLDHVLNTRPVDEVIIAIPSAGGRMVRMVTDICRLNGVPSRSMPGIYELLGGKVSVSRLREVDITDLLRREPVQIQNELIGASLSGKRVLVTGAGGSIGREICLQIARWGPSELVLLGHGENSIFEALLDLQDNYPSLPLQPVIADIRDLPRLLTIMKNHRPQVIFHTAAHKHVPLMEANVEEAVTNNIIGTRNVVEAAGACDVERLVMISSDKAIRPVSVMGATKRVAEMIVLDAAFRTGRAYSIVRFGNVLGSRGSVVPLFKRQIAHGGPVTITHPDMKRYFMTIPEAVHLVLQAAAMGQGGEVFLLNMGQQVRILDLAEDLIRLSGLEPGKDIEIDFTGIRPGEKLSEDLWDEGMRYQPTAHPEIFRVEEEETVPAASSLQQTVDELLRLAQDGEKVAILDLLDATIPSAAVRATPPPEFTSLV